MKIPAEFMEQDEPTIHLGSRRGSQTPVMGVKDQDQLLRRGSLDKTPGFKVHKKPIPLSFIHSFPPKSVYLLGLLIQTLS
jgi:hypothetical protein